MACCSSPQRQRPRAQDRPILCAMALANATVVFPKAAVEPPMERMFHAPVCSHGWGATDGITGERGQDKSLLDRDCPPTSRGDSPRPTLALLAHEPFMPKHSIAAVSQA